MSFNGVRLFRGALLFEIGANISSFIPVFLSPETTLSYLVKGPSQITPATKALTQWIGGMIVAFTVPLLLSYPNPRPSQGGNKDVAAFRKLTYMILGAGEAALGTIMAVQYLSGDSGLTDTALLSGTAMMGIFLGMRVFFLFVKPGWMEAQENSKKAQ